MPTNAVARPDAAGPEALATTAPEPAAAIEAPAAVATSPPPPVSTRRRADSAADPLGGSPVAPDVLDALRRRHGAGRPLPGEVAGPFGEQFGADLSGVRIHADAEADQLSRSVQATAFTHGDDVYFTQGAYAPQTTRGQHLLAHELAHVVQRRGGQDAGGGADGAGGAVIGRADDPAEAAADAAADHVLGALRRRADSASESPQHHPEGQA